LFSKLLRSTLLQLDRLVYQRFMNVRNDTTTGNGGFNKCIQFFISSNGKLQMPWSNTLHFQIFAGIACQFQNFSRQVFQYSRGIHSSRCSNALVLLYRTLEKSVYTTHWELQTRLRRTRLRSFLRDGSFASFSSLSTFTSFSRLQSLVTT